MKLTILGGGGFRVPLVYRALLADHEPGRVTQVRLYDTDPRRLAAIQAVLRDQASGHQDPPVVSVHTDLADAITGVDFIFSAIRVGGLQGRVVDERVALDLGVVGQETVGAGGIAYALRTIPEARRIARTIKRLAPEAWTINFTNPAGVVTEAMTRDLGDRVVGICDSPVGLARHALGALGITGGDVEIDYVGLNHLGWLRGLRVGGTDVLPRLLGDPAALATIEEGRLFGAELIEALAALPNEYLYYYYYTREVLQADLAVDSPRGAFLATQQSGFFARFEQPVPDPFALWDRTRLEREVTYMATAREAAGGMERDAQDQESGGYDRVALAIMRAISRDEQARLILNVPNRGLLPELDSEAVIEVPCLVRASGITALPTPGLPDHGRGLVTQVKYVERRELAAAESGSTRDAVLAFAGHPLVDSFTIARRLLDGYRQQLPDLDYLR